MPVCSGDGPVDVDVAVVFVMGIVGVPGTPTHT